MISVYDWIALFTLLVAAAICVFFAVRAEKHTTSRDRDVEKLRRENRRMQLALDEWNRCDRCSQYMTRHDRY